MSKIEIITQLISSKLRAGSYVTLSDIEHYGKLAEEIIKQGRPK